MAREHKGTERRQPENGAGRRNYDGREFCSDHSANCVRLDHLEKGQCTMTKKIESMHKLMMATAVTAVVATLAIIGNLVLAVVRG